MSERLKILYVDDEEINRRIFSITLKAKFDIVTAENALKGLEVLASETSIDVVVSDMKMPKMNGIEFIKHAKDKFPKIKFYILTGFSITDEIKEALVQGLIVKYFRKPFDLNLIGKEIVELI